MNTQLFDKKIDRVKNFFEKLINSPTIAINPLLYEKAVKQISGIYLFSERIEGKESFLYVGQSNNIINRLKEHCAFRNNDKANFAYKLTIKLTNLKPIAGTPNSTKKSMFRIHEFSEGFNKSIDRIKRMDYRWVEVDDKLEKNLLEIYASVILVSEYNEFN